MNFKLVGVVLAFCGAGFFVEVGATADDAAQGKATLYTGLTVIDGTGAPMQRDMAILVEDDRIGGILTANEAAKLARDGMEVVETSGWYAVPGLIDSHVHLATQPNATRAQATMRRYIYRGITSVRDMAGDARALAELARASKLKEISAPDLYYSALMAGPSFFKDPRPASAAAGEIPGQVPWMQAITPETDMKEAVAMARGTWATGIKIYANLDSSEVHRISTEAHRQGVKVWAHSMVFPATPSDVVDAGVDVISHVCRLAFELTDEKPAEYHHTLQPDYGALAADDPRLAALYAKMKAQGTILDATLWLNRHQAERRAANAERKAGPAVCPPDFAAALTAFAHASGVDIAAGTDVVLPSESQYPALFNELEALVHDAGMAPLQVIRSATYVGARALGLEFETGTIEAGKKADILFVAANPLDDITNLRATVLTLKGGTPYWRRDFVPLTSEELGDD